MLNRDARHVATGTVSIHVEPGLLHDDTTLYVGRRRV
jgi:hypothetical protein